MSTKLSVEKKGFSANLAGSTFPELEASSTMWRRPMRNLE